MPSQSLAGIGVLVTRPRQQSAELVEEIERRGGRAVLFPSLDIIARDKKSIADDVARLTPADVTIFISSNAVDSGIDYADGAIAAIGPATAAAVKSAGRNVAVQPASGFDTEHLLSESAFGDMNGKTVRIIRGNAGREQLAQTLMERGANVEYLSTYERRLPRYTQNVLDDLENHWRQGGIDAVVVMSVESLINLLSLLPDWCRRQLQNTPLVTPAARVLKEALNQVPGCTAILAAGPQASEIADSLEDVQRSQQPESPEPE